MNDIYVSTSSYISDSSDYVSSVVTDNTPFPSLSKSQKIKLNELIHGGKKPTPKVSTFTQKASAGADLSATIGEVSDMSFKEDTNENDDVKNSCCCLC